MITNLLASYPLVRPTGLKLPDRPFRGVAVIGSSCSGKTTLIGRARSGLPSTATPRRFITRSPRLGDDTIENAFCTHDQLDQYWRAKQLEVVWSRNLGGDRVEKYAFEKFLHDQPVLLSSNNAFARDEGKFWICNPPPRFLVVCIYAPDHVRRQRLEARSTDLIQNRPSEVAVRLNDSSEDAVQLAHLRVENYGKYEQDCLDGARHFFSDLLQICI